MILMMILCYCTGRILDVDIAFHNSKRAGACVLIWQKKLNQNLNVFYCNHSWSVVSCAPGATMSLLNDHIFYFLLFFCEDKGDG